MPFNRDQYNWRYSPPSSRYHYVPSNSMVMPINATSKESGRIFEHFNNNNPISQEEMEMMQDKIAKLKMAIKSDYDKLQKHEEELKSIKPCLKPLVQSYKEDVLKRLGMKSSHLVELEEQYNQMKEMLGLPTEVTGINEGNNMMDLSDLRAKEALVEDLKKEIIQKKRDLDEVRKLVDRSNEKIMDLEYRTQRLHPCGRTAINDRLEEAKIQLDKEQCTHQYLQKLVDDMEKRQMELEDEIRRQTEKWNADLEYARQCRAREEQSAQVSPTMEQEMVPGNVEPIILQTPIEPPTQPSPIVAPTTDVNVSSPDVNVTINMPEEKKEEPKVEPKEKMSWLQLFLFVGIPLIILIGLFIYLRVFRKPRYGRTYRTTPYQTRTAYQVRGRR